MAKTQTQRERLVEVERLVVNQANQIRKLQSEIEGGVVAAVETEQELKDLRYEYDNYLSRVHAMVNALPTCPACGMNPPIHTVSCWVFRK